MPDFVEFVEVVHLRTWVEECIETLFRDLGAPITRVTARPDRGDLRRCSCIGFGAKEMTGSLMLAANRVLLGASYAGDIPGEKRHSPSWVGELANLVMGRVKNEFWNHHIEDIGLGVPAMMNAHFMPPLTGNGAYPEPLFFSGPDGGLLVAWLDGQMSQTLVRKTMERRVDESKLLDAGDMLMF